MKYLDSFFYSSEFDKIDFAHKGIRIQLRKEIEKPGFYEVALCYYEKDINCGEALCEQRRSRMGLCQLLFGYRKRGDILSALGRITQALECRKKAVDIIKEIYESSSSEYDVARYIECLMELSYCLHQLGRIEEAEEYEALARELEGRLS